MKFVGNLKARRRRIQRMSQIDLFDNKSDYDRYLENLAKKKR